MSKGNKQQLNIKDMAQSFRKYYFGRHRRNWGIWERVIREDGRIGSVHVKDVFTYEEAVREIYRLNGWGEPKQIKFYY